MGKDFQRYARDVPRGEDKDSFFEDQEEKKNKHVFYAYLGTKKLGTVSGYTKNMAKLEFDRFFGIVGINVELVLRRDEKEYLAAQDQIKLTDAG